ncbi:uncharacterized membrane protein At3g27390-like isoform X3 [Vitis riparia]|uniref:uncharacterized membrane protein At3g27390-like isoform X3 n=1 Tax=Vitis riparia TaxID=96939 RepID=UPI00155A5821|nr:uncharacterized membrane protein At3g27390-like isoform X3 [Vitis riparia]
MVPVSSESEAQMVDSKGFLTYLCYFIFFLPVFVLLFALGIIKGGIFSPFVFLVIAFGDIGVVVGLWPCHLVWTVYCIVRTKKFDPYLKCLLILMVPIPIALWTVVGVVGSVIMGIGYGFICPVMDTFKAVSMEGVSLRTKLIRCFTDGTWSNVWGACTIVRDFADFSFHSYFSVMDGLLESKGEKPIELKVFEIPGLLILLWPIVVVLAALAGVISSFFFGCYAAVIAYQESSIKRGLLYIVASMSLFDESTNDFLYLREGSCFPRPRYRKQLTYSPTLVSVNGLNEQIHANEPLVRTSSEKKRALSAVMIWDNYFKACEHTGKELLRAGAVGMPDLETWRNSKNKIINIGIPAYSFLECFLHSIKSGSPGFLMRDNVELTSLNRPEGRVFDWMFEPMSIMKEQLKRLNLVETEELYLYKFSLYHGDRERMEAWQNGGFPPEDEIRRAQLEGISRRLQGFCLTLSRLPTSRRWFDGVVKEIEQEARRGLDGFDALDDLTAVV